MTTAVAVPEPTASLRLGAPTRDAFGRALQALGRSDERIVVVDGDVWQLDADRVVCRRFPGAVFQRRHRRVESRRCRRRLGRCRQNPGGGELCLPF